MPLRSPAERYLEDFHQRQPGTTSAAFAELPAVKYSSSYAALTAHVPTAQSPMNVLDLACGDGYLLKLLAARQQPGLQLTGVDMSQAELDAARLRLPSDVTLLKERAQALSMATGSVDVLLSHMAIMLMDDLEQVLQEVQRVLRSGGTLAVLIGRTFLLGPVGDAFLDAFRPIAKQDQLPHLPSATRLITSPVSACSTTGRRGISRPGNTSRWARSCRRVSSPAFRHGW